MSTPPIILSIAGSDPSGGAGVQADVKTISALGGYAAAVVTAVTVQNTQGVTTVEYLSPMLVGQQIEAVVVDMRPVAIKIGMMGTAAIVQAVAEQLKEYACPNVVLDPVMISTSGRALMDARAVETICCELFPLCRLVTPNLDEASLLLGEPIQTIDQMHKAAKSLFERYDCAFLIKGGHLQGEGMTDVLCDGEIHTFTNPRIETTNLHGTGCTLASAIATLLGRGLLLTEAVGLAKNYLERAIEAARLLYIGEGNGPLWHFVETSKLDRQ